MSNTICPTVRVKDDRSPHGYIVINESDLTDDHEVLADVVEGPKPDVEAEIPADWQSLHWKQQVKLAKALGRQGEPSGDEAKAFIAIKVEERATR